MKDASAAFTYARAFYLALKDRENASDLEKAAADFAALCKLIQEIEPVWSALTSALTLLENKKAALRAVFSAARVQPPTITLRFLDLLLSKKRFHLLSAIAQRLLEEAAAGSGKTKATVRSAFPLNENQLKNIEKTVSTFLKKNVAVENIVQQDLLAGMVVQIGDFVIDNSLKSRLKKLERELQSCAN